MANSISKEEIQKLLPHREPMLLIDKLINIDSAPLSLLVFMSLKVYAISVLSIKQIFISQISQKYFFLIPNVL